MALGFRVQGLGWSFWVQGSGFRVALGFRVQALGWVWGSGFRLSGGFRVQGLGLRVCGFATPGGPKPHVKPRTCAF